MLAACKAILALGHCCLSLRCSRLFPFDLFHAGSKSLLFLVLLIELDEEDLPDIDGGPDLESVVGVMG